MPFPRLWTHVRLSWEMARCPPDVLFVPAHVLPIVHPRCSVVTVHDLGYRHYPAAHRPLDRLYLDLSTRYHVRVAAHILADSQATRDDLIREYGAETLKLVIAGQKGWLYDRIFARARELDVEQRVIFPGYVAGADLPALLSGAQLFAFPSLYEGFGFPVLEAMACGVPVVCSNVSSLPEVAGDAALLVDPLDTGAWTTALERTLADEELRAELTTRGYAQVRRFSWQRAAEETLRVLEEAGA